MLILELTNKECIEVLTRLGLGRLACSRDDQPYIVPIFFSFDARETCLYGFSTAGRKIEWMRRNPKECVEVEEIVDKALWTTLLATGRYEEIHDQKRDHAFERVRELFQQRPEWWLPATAKLAGVEEHERPVFYRIRIDELTGRQAARPA